MFLSKAAIGPIFKLLVLLPVVLLSCKEKKEPREIERSFYYWKSVLNLTAFEKQRLDALQVKTIYIKFFDVDWDASTNKAVPVAKLTINEGSIRSMRSAGTTNFEMNVIPVIFITNTCIQKLDSTQIVELGNNISDLTFKLIERNAFNDIPEIQFDCDWTASTKEKYFALIKQFKKRFVKTTLSATIRLHQVKFLSKTGFPPVDRGLLMCYNMGN